MTNSIFNYTCEAFSRIIKPSFRAKQIFNWVYQNSINSFDQMKNLPKDLKSTLNDTYEISTLTILNKEVSKDGTIKYLFELHDKLTIETVLLKMKEKKTDKDGKILKSEKYTVCVSSQVGCKVGCAFCLTAQGGFKRDLLPHEIVEQIWLVRKDNDIPPNKSINIVYMGMGEPLDNFDNLVKAIEIISDDDGLNISAKRQTISTSGISSKITKLGELDLGVNMAISLHAVDDTLRSKLIPMNKAYNITSVIEALQNFPINKRKRIMFEYLVIKDINDSLSAAQTLVKLLNGMKVKVNLIYYNQTDVESEFKRPSKENMIKFQEYLLSKGVFCTIRDSKGNDISAACGQLKEKTVKSNNEWS